MPRAGRPTNHLESNGILYNGRGFKNQERVCENGWEKDGGNEKAPDLGLFQRYDILLAITFVIASQS